MRTTRLIALCAAALLAAACGGTASTNSSSGQTSTGSSGTTGQASSGSSTTTGSSTSTTSTSTTTSSGSSSTTTTGSSSTTTTTSSGSSGSTGSSSSTTTTTTSNSSSTGSSGSNGTTSSTTTSTSSGSGSTSSSSGGTTGGLACNNGVEAYGVPVLAAGSDTFGLHLADVNNDGKLDLVFGNYSGSTLSVMLGYGDGTFANRSTFNAGSGAGALAIGEFTGDTKVDVAMLSSGYNGSVTLLKGAATGAFTSAGTLDPDATAAYWYGSDLVAADIDGDGRADLIESDGSHPRLGVYFSQDGGGFRAMQTFGATNVSGYYGQMAVADFNGDSAPDVAVVDSYNGNDVKLFINSSGGLAAQSGTLATCNSISGIAVGNLNTDANADLVVVCDSAVSVLLGQGNASFAAKTDLPLAFNGAVAVALIDVDHDGDLDLVVTGSSTPGLSQVFYNDGSGHFTAGETYDTVRAGTSAAGDVTGDGLSDLVVAGYYGEIQVLASNPDHSLESGREIAGATTNPETAPVAANLNADGIPDLVALTRADNSVTVWMSLAAGVYDVAVPYSLGAGASPSGLIVADFTADQKLDIAVANAGTNQVEVLAGDGTGTFGLPKYTDVSAIASSSTQALAAGDFDRDGKLDVAVIDSTNHCVWILINHATSTSQFQAPVQVPLPNNAQPVAIIAGQFTSDTNVDLAVIDSASTEVITLINDGSGNFTTSTFASLGHSGANHLALADADGQAPQDLVVAESGYVEVLTGSANGTFTVVPTGVTGYGAALADVTGDGIPDLVVTDGSYRMLLYPAITAGNYGTAQPFPLYGGANPVLADLNGDGTLDVLATSRFGLSYWLNTCWH